MWSDNGETFSIAALTSEIAALEQRRLGARPVADDLNVSNPTFRRGPRDDEDPGGSSSQSLDGGSIWIPFHTRDRLSQEHRNKQRTIATHTPNHQINF